MMVFKCIKGQGRLIAYNLCYSWHPNVVNFLTKNAQGSSFFKRYLYSNYWAITDTLFGTVIGSVQCRISAKPLWSLVTNDYKLTRDLPGVALVITFSRHFSQRKEIKFLDECCFLQILQHDCKNIATMV